MARASQAKGLYRVGGILCLVGGVATFFVGAGYNLFGHLPLGALAFLVGAFTASTGKGEGAALGLAAAGTAVMGWGSFMPPDRFVANQPTTLAWVLFIGAAAVFLLATLVIVRGGLLVRRKK